MNSVPVAVVKFKRKDRIKFRHAINQVNQGYLSTKQAGLPAEASAQAGIAATIVVLVVSLTVAIVVASVLLSIRVSALKAEQQELQEQSNQLKITFGKLSELQDEIVKPVGFLKTEKLPTLEVKNFLQQYRQRLFPVSLDTSQDLIKKMNETSIFSTLQDLVPIAYQNLIEQKNRHDLLKSLLSTQQEKVNVLTRLQPILSQTRINYISVINTETDKLNQQIQQEDASFLEQFRRLEEEERQIPETKDQEAMQTEHLKRILNIKIQRKQRELQELLRAIEVIKYRITIYHGKIVRPDLGLKVAFINLGSKNGIKNGLRFLVARQQRRGNFEYKGEVEVKKVWLTYSEVQIRSIFDIKNPIIDGDVIVNPFFNPFRPVVVALIGKGKTTEMKISFRDAASRIQDIGGVVTDTIGPQIDFVIVSNVDDIENPTERQEQQTKLRQAIQLGIPIAHAVDVLGFLED